MAGACAKNGPLVLQLRGVSPSLDDQPRLRLGFAVYKPKPSPLNPKPDTLKKTKQWLDKGVEHDLSKTTRRGAAIRRSLRPTRSLHLGFQA